MPLGAIQRVIRDGSGRVVRGATVAVLDPATDSPLEIFSDRDGVSEITSGLSTDNNGYFIFYTRVGRVHVNVSYGSQSQQLRDLVSIDDFPG